MGGGAGLRRFHRQAIWRARYDLVGETAHAIPVQLDLQMQLGRLLADQTWALSVTLNDRLVFQEHVAGTRTDFRALSDLPADMQGPANTLEIVVTHARAQSGVCDQGPELVAEMLPGSRLIAGNTPFSNPLSEVRAALAAVGVVNLSVMGALSALDADAASRLLDQVVPAGATLKPATGTSHVVVLGADHAALPPIGSRHAWLVTQDATGQGLSVQDFRAGDELLPSRLGLLVIPNASVFREAEG